MHSASGIFQRELESRLASISFVKVRSDDILVSYRNVTEHFEILERVLKVVHDNGLGLKFKKCVFLQDEVVYLGFKINKNGIHPVKEKIEAIKNAKEPRNVSEPKSFLGLINYYHRHFQNFANKIRPLHRLLRKGVKRKWQEKEKLAFEEAKSILDEATFLIHYDLEKPLLLACDAAPYGLGEVLSHQMPDGSEKPITFESRTLTKTERNYSQIEKEALAIVYAVKTFHQYLFGRHFFCILTINHFWDYYLN